jgi:hypothetical protein
MFEMFYKYNLPTDQFKLTDDMSKADILSRIKYLISYAKENGGWLNSGV